MQDQRRPSCHRLGRLGDQVDNDTGAADCVTILRLRRRSSSISVDGRWRRPPDILAYIVGARHGEKHETDMGNSFIAIFLGTIAATRVLLFIRPTPGVTIAGVRIHHYVYGLIGVPVALFLHSLPLYAVSLALVIDEVIYVLIGGKTHADNYSAISLIGVSALAFLAYLLRNVLVLPLS